MYENLTEARKQNEPKTFRAIHRRAIFAVEELKSKEANLILALQDVDDQFVYRYLGYNSLFQYCLKALKLTDAQSGMYITVARKSKNLPALQDALLNGEVSVSKISRVTSVINESNQQYWLDLSKEASKSEIEKEVAKVNPRGVFHEKARYVTDTVLEMQLPIDEDIFADLKKVQDLMSQKTRRHLTLEEVIGVLTKDYLKKHDPTQRHQRREARKEKARNRPSCKEESDIATDKTDVAGFSAPLETYSEAPSKASSEAVSKVTSDSSRANPSNRPYNDQRTASQNKNQNSRCPGSARKLKRSLMDAVLVRDQGQCTFLTENILCGERRWLHVHHIIHQVYGGTDELGNLRTLCFQHHKMMHAH